MTLHRTSPACSPSRAAFITTLALTTAAAILRPADAAVEVPPTSVTFAYQPGVGYTPFIVLQKQGLLAKLFPGTKFAWQELASGSAVRDGMVAGAIQIGAAGMAPFLIGWDKGVPWKILTAANNLDLWLVVMDPTIKTLKDLKPGDKIAMPAPDSIQGVVLRKALANQGLDPHSLDAGFVAMGHPLAQQALLNKQVMGHMGAPPFSQAEVKAGGHVVMKEQDAFPGGITSTIVAVNAPFATQYPQFVEGVYKAFLDTTAFIKQHPNEAAKMYVDYTGGKADEAEVAGILRASGARLFANTPHGAMKSAEFMKQIGILSKAPATFAELALPNLGKAGD